MQGRSLLSRDQSWAAQLLQPALASPHVQCGIGLQSSWERVGHAVPAAQDVAKRVFELDGDKTTRVACHYGEDEAGMGRLARAVRVYGESAGGDF